jgi:hypothetical protein
MKDEILTELWMIKDSIAKENNNNVATLMNHLKSIQDSSGRRVVNRFQNKKMEATR